MTCSSWERPGQDTPRGINWWGWVGGWIKQRREKVDDSVAPCGTLYGPRERTSDLGIPCITMDLSLIPLYWDFGRELPRGFRASVMTLSWERNFLAGAISIAKGTATVTQEEASWEVTSSPKSNVLSRRQRKVQWITKKSLWDYYQELW